MKKVLAISSLAILSTTASAFDYKFNLEGRGDFVNANVKTTATAGTTTTEKWNNFSNSLIRLNLMGNINENLSYRFRYRFMSTGATPATAREVGNGDSTLMDYLYVDHKNQWFTTRVGRQNWVDAYGRESYVSGTDVFLVSQAATNFKADVGDYRWGASGIYKFAETNMLTLALSNPNKTFTDATGAERKNTGVAMGAYYTGSFAEKVFQPTLGYTLAKQNGDVDAAAGATTKDGDNTLWNVGFRSEVAGFIIDADYKTYEKENRNSGTTTTFVKEETKSIYTSVAYAAGEFTPIAYYINDKFDSETNTLDFKRNAYAFGTNWKPMADVNFRYHLMFSNDTKKFDNTAATNSKITDRRVWLGFKADI